MRRAGGVETVARFGATLLGGVALLAWFENRPLDPRHRRAATPSHPLLSMPRRSSRFVARQPNEATLGSGRPRADHA